MGWRVIGVAGRGGKATGQKDLLRPALEEIIDLGHPLVRLAREIDWGFPIGAFPACARRVRGVETEPRSNQ